MPASPPLGGRRRLLAGSHGDPTGAPAATSSRSTGPPAADGSRYVRLVAGTIRCGTACTSVTAARAGHGVARLLPGSVEDRPRQREPCAVASAGLDAIQIGDVISGAVATPRATGALRTTDPRGGRRARATRRSDPAVDRAHPARRAGPAHRCPPKRRRHQLTVSLFGEVQREVLAARRSSDFALRVTVPDATPLCVERPHGVAEVRRVPELTDEPLRRDPRAPRRAGPSTPASRSSERRPRGRPPPPLQADGRLRRVDAPVRRRGAPRGPLRVARHGLHVTITECDYGGNDGPPSKRGPAPSNGLPRLTALVVRPAVAEGRDDRLRARRSEHLRGPGQRDRLDSPPSRGWVPPCARR